MGFTFKENCPDIRNTRVIDIVKELQEYEVNAYIYDTWVKTEEVQHEYGIDIIQQPEINKYDAIILAVAHSEFKQMPIEQIKAYSKADAVIYDLKYLYPRRANRYSTLNHENTCYRNSRIYRQSLSLASFGKRR